MDGRSKNDTGTSTSGLSQSQLAVVALCCEAPNSLSSSFNGELGQVRLVTQTWDWFLTGPTQL